MGGSSSIIGPGRSRNDYSDLSRVKGQVPSAFNRLTGEKIQGDFGARIPKGTGMKGVRYFSKQESEQIHSKFINQTRDYAREVRSQLREFPRDQDMRDRLWQDVEQKLQYTRDQAQLYRGTVLSPSFATSSAILRSVQKRIELDSENDIGI